MSYRSHGLLLALAGVIALAACSGSTPTQPTPAPTPPPAPPVVQPSTDPAPDPEPPPEQAPPPVPRISATRFLAFGDSFTEGHVSLAPSWLAVVPSQSYPFKLQGLLAGRYTEQAITVVNGGLSGEHARDAESRFLELLDSVRPEVVLLMEGVNDLNLLGEDGVRPALDAVEELLQRARADGARALVATLPPQRPDSHKGVAWDIVDEFNAGLKKMAADEGAIVVDVNAAFGGDLSLIGADGLHPNEVGYERIAQAFFDVIRASFEVSPAQETAP